MELQREKDWLQREIAREEERMRQLKIKRMEVQQTSLSREHGVQIELQRCSFMSYVRCRELRRERESTTEEDSDVHV